MPGRRFALAATLGLIAVIAFLTVYEMAKNGPTGLTAVSLLILALFGFGVVGALTQPPDD
jgi:hypothetical protein